MKSKHSSRKSWPAEREMSCRAVRCLGPGADESVEGAHLHLAALLPHEQAERGVKQKMRKMLKTEDLARNLAKKLKA